MISFFFLHEWDMGIGIDFHITQIYKRHITELFVYQYNVIQLHF